MTYKDIPGWFDFEAFYDRVVAEAKTPATFVEVGCWLGKSTAYLASRMVGSMKDIRLFVYDTFAGSDNEPELLDQARKVNVEESFVANMERCGIYMLRFVECLALREHSPARVWYDRIDSLQASARHADGSLDFVFLDGCHTFEAVQADIKAWRPKVKTGGMLAGHDYNTYDTVRRAVHQAFPNPGTEGNCWFVRL